MPETMQELFNKAVLGLRAQGWERGVGVPGTCVYLNWKGNRCAYGHMMSVEFLGTLHDEDWMMVSECIMDKYMTAPGRELREFVSDCQRAHDKSICPDDMERRMRAVAEKYNLTFP